MEPMTLGSPVGSPTTGRSSPGSHQSPYTPAFLIRNEFTSPQRNGSYNQSFTHQREQTQPQSPFTSNKVLNYKLNEVQKQSPAMSKTGGPPTTRLFDSLDSVNTMSAPPPKLKNLTNLNQSQNLNNTSFGTPVGSNSLESQSCWVTMFGFMSENQCQAIVSQLGQIGNIVEFRYPAKKEESNWVHLRFNSRMEVKRVLAYNGKIYGNTMMGVVPCRDMSVLRDTTNLTSPLNTSYETLLQPVFNVSYLSSLQSVLRDTTNLTSPLNTSYGGDTTSPRDRVFNTSYWENTLNSAPITHDPPMLFMQENDNVTAEHLPSTGNGLMSKTLDYLFGW
uniref:Nucleoporin NUP53 n=1 Tax=Cacopsylla melanoneura TaxID=428564 RepID=A0A8D8X5E3_9HEMI